MPELLDEQRKHAYRYLLYRAMPDIRPLAWRSFGWFHLWTWRRQALRMRYAGAIADWLHNLALFSALDFRGFEEERFWQDFQGLLHKFPGFRLENYRSTFEERMARPPVDWA